MTEYEREKVRDLVVAMTDEEKEIAWEVLVEKRNDRVITPEEAIVIIKNDISSRSYPSIKAALKIAIEALKEVKQYRKIGTVEECKKAVKEEDTLKFYYCESEDDYYIGKRVGNFYYARYAETGFEWFMSRYLPWGEHVVKPNTLWKEYTYPSEPKEIPFFEWLQGFVKKYFGGTAEECREAAEKQKAKKCVEESCPDHTHYKCPSCGKIQKTKYGDSKFGCILNYCSNCGQALDENLEGME